MLLIGSGVLTPKCIIGATMKDVWLKEVMFKPTKNQSTMDKQHDGSSSHIANAVLFIPPTRHA
jgi:hypothetical protein